MENELIYITKLCEDCMLTCIYKDYAQHFATLNTKEEIFQYVNTVNEAMTDYQLMFNDTDDVTALKRNMIYQLVEFALKEKEIQNQY
jgi:hypothetical protein